MRSSNTSIPLYFSSYSLSFRPSFYPLRENIFEDIQFFVTLKNEWLPFNEIQNHSHFQRVALFSLIPLAFSWLVPSSGIEGDVTAAKGA